MKINYSYLKKVEKLEHIIGEEKRKIIEIFEKLIDEYDVIDVLNYEVLNSVFKQISEQKYDNEVHIILPEKTKELKKEIKENVINENINKERVDINDRD